MMTPTGMQTVLLRLSDTKTKEAFKYLMLSENYTAMISATWEKAKTK